MASSRITDLSYVDSSYSHTNRHDEHLYSQYMSQHRTYQSLSSSQLNASENHAPTYFSSRANVMAQVQVQSQQKLIYEQKVCQPTIKIKWLESTSRFLKGNSNHNHSEFVDHEMDKAIKRQYCQLVKKRGTSLLQVKTSAEKAKLGHDGNQTQSSIVTESMRTVDDYTMGQLTPMFKLIC